MKNMKKIPSAETEAFYLFVFQKFKTSSQVGPTYSAKYTSGKSLVITGNTIDLKSETWEKFRGKKAWELFFKYAAFEEILTSYPRPHFYFEKSNAVIPETPDLFSLKTDKERHMANLDYKKQVLHAIRENPSVLSCMGMRYNKATEILMEVLNTARSTNKKDADEARELLKDYLIPTNPGGKIPLPPKGVLNLISELTSKLASHLSKTCRESLNYPLERATLNDDAYADIIKKILDDRIKSLSKKELTLLFFKPAEFANKQIESYFKISKSTRIRSLRGAN